MTISPNGLLTRNDDSGIVYDLPGRMSVKEALLREHLKELFPADYYNMLLLSNERALVQDNYHKISISCGGGIYYELKSYAKSGSSMTEEQVDKIADTILAHHQEQRALCTVKCDEIIADYAKLMVQIEAASNGTLDEIIESDASVDEPARKVEAPKIQPWYKRMDWGSLAAGFAAIVIPSVVTAVVTHKG